jgi:hypothetical protein
MNLQRCHALARCHLVLFLGAAFNWGCEQHLSLPVVVNQRPHVYLTHAPANSDSARFYAYELRWRGFDPDGPIARFEYAIDPTGGAFPETAWVSTIETRRLFHFESDSLETGGVASHGLGYHTFVIRSVDAEGLQSSPLTRSFSSFTVAPQVFIEDPTPSAILFRLVPPSVEIRWRGEDVDGLTGTQPTGYRYRLFKEGAGPISFASILASPDTLRRFYGPDFADWDSIGSNVNTLRLESLVPNSRYVFAIVAFDEAGAHSGPFSLYDNLLALRVSYAGAAGPRLHVVSSVFDYTYVAGGFATDEIHTLEFQLPADYPLDVQWTAIPEEGSTIRAYRWAIDIERLDDETPRSNEVTDIRHWSSWALASTSARLGPFEGGAENEEHTLFIEVEDNNGSLTLGLVRASVVAPSFERPLLFVNDTRLAVDQLASGASDSVRAPTGNWPSSAELDTFLFARGNVRWRYMPGGVQSAPGIFAGYEFDTLGTRQYRLGPVPIATLFRYRNVVWMTNAAPTYDNGIEDFRFPQTHLRYMSRDVFNTLGAYAAAGGRVWIMGGGAAFNSLIAFNQTANDRPNIVFDVGTGELGPGRLMFDIVGWRAQVSSGVGQQALRSERAVGGWPGCPDYARVPAELQPKSPGTDPLPPLRGSSAFYRTISEADFISATTIVLDETSASSILDTLMVSTGTGLPVPPPSMTFFHPRGMPASVMFSGFAPWFFRRSQGIELADFVLQDVWGFERQSSPR